MHRRLRTPVAWLISLLLHTLAILVYLATHPPKMEEIPNEIEVALNVIAPPPRPPRIRPSPQPKPQVVAQQRSTQISRRTRRTFLRDVTFQTDQRVTYADVPVEQGETLLPGGMTEMAGDGLRTPILTQRIRQGPRVVRVQQKPLVAFVNQIQGRRSIVYCLDISASMSAREFDKLTMAKNYLHQSLQALRETDTFDIVVFSRQARLFRPHMVPATEENVEAAVQFLAQFTHQSVQANRQTDLLRALEAAAQLNPNVVVLMTDGLPTVGEVHPNRIAERFYARNPAVHVYAVGFGMGPRDPGTYMLQMLAAKNGEVELIQR